MTITLDEASEKLLQQELDRGSYSGPDEVIAQALHLLQGHSEENWLVQNKEAINESIQAGYAAIERKETYSWEEAQAILDARRSARSVKAA